MVDGGRIGRPRLLVAWGLTLAVLALAVLDAQESDEPSAAPTSTDEPDEGAKLRIVAVSDAEVVPGDAVVVTARGVDPAPAQPLEARVDKRPAEILSRQGDRLVVRIPTDIASGKSSIRIAQGARRSKPHDLLVRPLRPRKILRNLIGGLALLVIGIAFFSRGLRGLAGRGLRSLFERLTHGTVRGLGFGATLGGLTQMTTASAGVVIGLLEARLLALHAAIALLFGAQLGAAATGLFLPLTLGKESLLVVAIGAVWTTLAADRRSESFGQTLLGFGFLLYGLHLVRVSVDPLVANPHVIAYVESFQLSTLAGRLLCVAAGVLLAVLLQGPAPVFALVVALVQISGALSFSQALAILTGTDLGAGLLVLMVTWSSSRRARPLGTALLVLGAAATTLAIVSLDLWVFVADALVPGQPGEMAHGEKVLLPHMALHLAVGFMTYKLATMALLAGLIPWLARWVRRPSTAAGAAEPAEPAELAVGLSRDLARVMASDRLALAEILELCRRGDRSLGVSAEHALRQARRTMEAVFARVVHREADGPSVEPIRRAVITGLQMQLTLEDLLRLVERNVEINMVLLTEDVRAIEGLHQLVLDGLDALIVALEQGTPPDLEGARAREIQLNAREAEARDSILRSSGASASPGRVRNTTDSAATIRVGLTDLLHAYENIGNPLYRVCQSLVTDVKTVGDWSARRTKSAARSDPP